MSACRLVPGLVLLGLVSCQRSGEPPSRPASPPRSAAEVLAQSNELSRRHRVAEALAVLETYRAGQPGPPRDEPESSLHGRQAELLLILERPREALEILEVLAPKRKDMPFLKVLAQAALDAGEPSRALAVLAQAPAGQTQELLLEEGKALAALGRPGEAAAALAAALARDPWLDTAYLELGRVLARSGDSARGNLFLERYRAADSYRRADQEAVRFEFDGDEARACHRRATAELERGRLYEVLQLDNRALQLSPGLGDAYLQLGRLSVFLARPAEAIRVLEKLPQNTAVAQVLEEARQASLPPSTAPHGSLEAGKLEVARLQQGKALSASVPELLELARIHRQSAQPGPARQLSLLALRLATTSQRCRETVREYFDAPGEAFVRLWAALGLPAADRRRILEEELQALGVDPGEVERRLAGGPLR